MRPNHQISFHVVPALSRDFFLASSFKAAGNCLLIFRKQHTIFHNFKLRRLVSSRFCVLASFLRWFFVEWLLRGSRKEFTSMKITISLFFNKSGKQEADKSIEGPPIPHYRFARYLRQASNGLWRFEICFRSIRPLTRGSDDIWNIHSTLFFCRLPGQKKCSENFTEVEQEAKRFSFSCFMHEAILKYDHESGEKREICWLPVGKHVCGELWLGWGWQKLFRLASSVEHKKRCFWTFFSAFAMNFILFCVRPAWNDWLVNSLRHLDFLR